MMLKFLRFFNAMIHSILSSKEKNKTNSKGDDVMFTLKNSITCIDTHTGGEPTRIVIGGFPSIPGKTIP